MLSPVSILLVIATLAAIVLSPAQASEPVSPTLPPKLTLQSAVQILREQGLDLLITEAAIQGAQGDLRIAEALPNPALSLGYGRSRAQRTTEGDPSATPPIPSDTRWVILKDPVLSASLSDQASLQSILFGKRGLRSDVARAALAAARMSRLDAERILISLVKQQFVQALVARAALQFTRAVQDTSSHSFNLSETRYRAGAISEADLARVETAKLESDQAADVAAQNYRIAQVGLAFLLGIRSAIPDFELDEPGVLHYSLPASLSGMSREALLRDALERRSDLKALQFQKQRAESSIALAKRLRIPDIALSLSYTQQGTMEGVAISPPTLTLGLSAPLPLLYQQQGEIQKAEADYRMQFLQYQRAEAQVVNDVETAHAAFVSSEQLVKRMEGRLLERSARAKDLVSFQYQKGAASLLEFLDAQRTYIATNIEYLQDLTAYWMAVFKLEQAVGMEFR